MVLIDTNGALLSKFGTQAVLAYALGLQVNFGYHHQIYWMARDESDLIGREFFHIYVKILQRPFLTMIEIWIPTFACASVIKAKKQLKLVQG
jgi:hypothetical protein